VASATSTGDVERGLAAGWRAITGEPLGVDFAGADLESVREVAQALLSLARRFPEAQLRRVEIFDLDPREAALTQGTVGFGSAIILNRLYFVHGRRQVLLDVLEKSVKSGLLVAPSIEVKGVVTHEFGHVLDIQAGPSWAADLIEEIARLARSAGVDPDHGTNLEAFIERELSRYALRGPLEIIAEAFAEVVLAPPDRPARSLAQLVYSKLMAALGRSV